MTILDDEQPQQFTTDTAALVANAEEATNMNQHSTIPTRMDIFYDLNGSLGFAIGSSGFVLSMYYDEWLAYFRYGSHICWIWGCVFYAIPLLLKFRNTEGDICFPWDIGELGVFLCCLFYTIGCVFGGFFSLATVERFLPLINHLFLFGSLSLALEPAWEAILFVVRGGSFMDRMRRTKLWGVPSSSSASSLRTNTMDADIENSGNGSTSSSDNNEHGVERHTDAQTPTPLKFNWDRCFELGAMIFFCAAGAFGGFPPHPSLALPGQYFWEVGSLFSVARSVVMIRRRSAGLKQLQQKELLAQKKISTLRKNRQ